MTVESYDAMVSPDPEAWLALGEEERTNLVRAYHQSIGDTGENETVHCLLHAIVENQVAMGAAVPVQEKMRQLMAQGLDRHTAVHAIAYVLANHMRRLSIGHMSADSHERRYYSELRRLNARKYLMAMSGLGVR